MTRTEQLEQLNDIKAALEAADHLCGNGHLHESLRDLAMGVFLLYELIRDQYSEE